SFPLDGRRGLELLECLDSARGQPGAGSRRLGGQDEGDRIWIAIGLQPALEQRVDEPGRCRAADLPLGSRPAAFAQGCAYLREHRVDLLEREPLPLDGVPGRARAEAKRVAAGVDAL